MATSTIRTFRHDDLDVAQLAERAGDLRISVCLPARDEAETIGPIVSTLRARLMDDVPLVDELVVVDDHSTDDTARVASDAGARVVRAAEVLPELGLGPGKGQAMWKGLYVTSGDLVAWCDADIRRFDERFVVGVVGPLVEHADISFVKGFYDRPVGRQVTGGGRTTELVARPLLSLLFPHLASLVQPLSGEYGGRRDLLERVPFIGGYGVEIGLLIDVAAEAGIDAMAQVDLGVRLHRNRPLAELGPQAATIVRTALERARPGLVPDPSVLVRPGVDPVPVDLLQLPPIAEVRADRGDNGREVRHTA